MKLVGTRRDCVRSRWVLTLSVLPMLNAPPRGREEGGREGGAEGKEGGRKREGEISRAHTPSHNSCGGAFYA